MSSEFLPHLFEPFSQEQSKIIQTRYTGTGLGMPIVKRLVELMGGTIEVESEQGKGTVVTLTIPFQKATAPVVPAADAKSRYDLTGCRILLCEDHPLNRSIAVKLLSKAGCAVDCAENGKIGVKLFSDSAEGYYDCILMDIRMPELDGLEATRRIRALGRSDAKTVPIIAMSANAFDDDVEKSLSAGMNAHIAKPFVPENLFGEIYRQTGRASQQ